MRRYFFILSALLSIVSLMAKADAVVPVSGELQAGVEYTIPETGSFDKYYTCSETLTAGQTIVVFYYSHDSSYLMNVPVYFGPDGNNPSFTNKTETDAAGNKIGRVIANASTLLDESKHPVIELYQPDNANATWCYVICSEDEAETIDIPGLGVGGGPTTGSDQGIDNAIVLTQDIDTDFKTTNKILYVKFTPVKSGKVTMNLSVESNYARWMEDGVMTTGGLKQNYFTNGNQFNAEKGKTYYCYYSFDADVEGTISYAIEAFEPGAVRVEAILLDANGVHNLLGIAHVNEDYFNKTTWFKIEKGGALANNDLLSVAIGGGNETEVALYKNDEKDYIKAYAMGSGSGMLPENSTVKFDVNVVENDYYIAITQDDVNGTANFNFSVAKPGETILKAFTAVEGTNTVTNGGWYKYTHAGDSKLIKLSGINKVVNENGVKIAEGDDLSAGFHITDGTTIYFEAVISFTITLTDIEPGMTPGNAIVITNEKGATFELGTSIATDTQRFMKYTATEDGTFLYGTTNKKVIEFAVSATVRDVTNPDAPKAVSIIQEENTDFGETYFIYKWPVVAGHTYAIEQGLGNNFGKVEFLTLFTAAEAGETIGKAIAVDLYDAVDLGRKATTAKYYKFTAEEAGDYTISVQMKGYVKSYDAEGKGSSIAQSYTDGLAYHNGTFTLTQGETLVFSCEPSETINHIDVDIKDEFIPNYYATVTKVSDSKGLDYMQPITISENYEMSLSASNVWYGPVTIPADSPLYVEVNLTDKTKTTAVYFAVQTSNGLQWINTNNAISVSIEDTKQIFTIAKSAEERQIQILGYGLKCAGTFKYSFTKPGSTTNNLLILDVEPELAYPKGIYTLSGQKVDKLEKGQVYIINGAKVMAK